MSLYSKYGTNKEAETKGVAIKFDDVTFYVKRAGGQNREYAKCFAEKLQKAKELTPEKAELILAEIFAETIVVGWDNLEKDGKLVEYSKEACVQLLLDLPDFAKELQQKVSDLRTFQVDDLKN